MIVGGYRKQGPEQPCCLQRPDLSKQAHGGLRIVVACASFSVYTTVLEPDASVPDELLRPQIRLDVSGWCLSTVPISGTSNTEIICPIMCHDAIRNNLG